MTANGDAHIARLKACIGYQAEPVRDAKGYWVIGYGRRLNDKPGGPKPEAYWSEQFADEELRHRVAAARAAIPEARELASMGRGGDTEIAHLSLGEIVVPSVLQTPEVMRALSTAAAVAGVSLDRFRLGMPQNSINSDTGMAEFWFGNRFGKNPLDVPGADDLAPEQPQPPLLLNPSPEDMLESIVKSPRNPPVQKNGWSGENGEIGVGADPGTYPPAQPAPTAKDRGLDVDPFVYRYSPQTNDRMIQRGFFHNELWDI